MGLYLHQKVTLLAMTASLSLHLVLGFLLVLADSPKKSGVFSLADNAVKVKVIKKEKKSELNIQPKEPPPPEPIKKDRPKKSLTPVPTFTQKEPKKSTEKNEAKPSYGLAPDSFDPSGKSAVTAPMGNTLGIDPKIRSDNIEPLSGKEIDLSREARLVKSSVAEPKYTPDAEDAGIEGIWIVEVFVNDEGKVEEAMLKKKIGFGMDERLLDAAKSARFEPRINKNGQALAGWTEIKFRLILP